MITGDGFFFDYYCSYEVDERNFRKILKKMSYLSFGEAVE